MFPEIKSKLIDDITLQIELQSKVNIEELMLLDANLWPICQRPGVCYNEDDVKQEWAKMDFDTWKGEDMHT